MKPAFPKGIYTKHHYISLMKRQTLIFLSIIFILCAGVRLYFAFQAPHFSEDSAYFTLREVEEIKDKGIPLYEDPLSYGGREYFFLPLFHYVLAFFSLFLNIEIVAKIIPNILAASITIVVFMIVKFMTKDDRIALLCSFMAGIVPIFISETINSVSALSVVIPLTFLLFYRLLRLRSRKSPYWFLIILIILLLTSSYTIIIALAMVLYILFSWVEGFKTTRSEIELTLFSLFLVTWFYFIFFKGALLLHGFDIIWQNIPTEVIAQYYADAGLNIIYLIGVIPLVCGVIVLYHYTFRSKKKSIYLFLSLILIVTILLILKYIELNAGLMYIAITLVVLSGEAIHLALKYLQRTKFAKYQNHLMVLFLIIIVSTSFFPIVTSANQKISESDPAAKVFALQLLENFSNSGDTVIGSVFDGHLITYYTKRKNVIDSNFLLIDAKPRLRDIRTIYTSAINIRPLEIMRKYNAKYVILTDETKKYYNISDITYADDYCLPVFYTGKGITIYQRKC